MMNQSDTEKLAKEAWDKVGETSFAACTMEHQLKLCSAVNSIEQQLELDKPPATNIAGLEDFDKEVIKRLTAIAVKEEKAADKPADKPTKTTKK